MHSRHISFMARRRLGRRLFPVVVGISSSSPLYCSKFPRVSESSLVDQFPQQESQDGSAAVPLKMYVENDLVPSAQKRLKIRPTQSNRGRILQTREIIRRSRLVFLCQHQVMNPHSPPGPRTPWEPKRACGAFGLSVCLGSVVVFGSHAGAGGKSWGPETRPGPIMKEAICPFKRERRLVCPDSVRA